MRGEWQVGGGLTCGDGVDLWGRAEWRAGSRHCMGVKSSLEQWGLDDGGNGGDREFLTDPGDGRGGEEGSR